MLIYIHCQRDQDTIYFVHLLLLERAKPTIKYLAAT